MVVVGATAKLVVAYPAVEAVVSRAPVESVVAPTAEESVITSFAVDERDAARRVDRVVAGRADDRVADRFGAFGAARRSCGRGRRDREDQLQNKGSQQGKQGPAPRLHGHRLPKPSCFYSVALRDPPGALLGGELQLVVKRLQLG